jgi:thiamine pyridinylase
MDAPTKRDDETTGERARRRMRTLQEKRLGGSKLGDVSVNTPVSSRFPGPAALVEPNGREPLIHPPALRQPTTSNGHIPSATFAYPGFRYPPRITTSTSAEWRGARRLLMKINQLLISCGAALIIALTSACSSSDGKSPQQASNTPSEPRALRVALYPYVPEREKLFLKLEEEFERTHKGVDLQLVDLFDYYYNFDKPDSLRNTNADVVEVDSAAILDLVKAKRIRPIPDRLKAPAGTYVRVAEEAVVVDGVTYGVPHWLCTNFLFVRKGDPLEQAKTLQDLRAAFGGRGKPEEGLLMDLKGKSTLGETYLDALIDRDRDMDAASQHLTLATLDAEIGRVLDEIRSFCEPGMCRNDGYHDAAGFYARMFAHKRGRALVGYSERLHYIHGEYQNGCRKDSKGKSAECVAPVDEEISVVPLPLSDKGSQPFAWVDSLAIAQSCDGQCASDAAAFIELATKAGSVLAALVPKEYSGESPRYLLPALASLYNDPNLQKAAPLYDNLEPALRNAVLVRADSLVPNLREIGNKLDTDLIRP